MTFLAPLLAKNFWIYGDGTLHDSETKRKAVFRSFFCDSFSSLYRWPSKLRFVIACPCRRRLHDPSYKIDGYHHLKWLYAVINIVGDDYVTIQGNGTYGGMVCNEM